MSLIKDSVWVKQKKQKWHLFVDFQIEVTCKSPSAQTCHTSLCLVLFLSISRDDYYFAGEGKHKQPWRRLPRRLFKLYNVTSVISSSNGPDPVWGVYQLLSLPSHTLSPGVLICYAILRLCLHSWVTSSRPRLAASSAGALFTRSLSPRVISCPLNLRTCF